jgi:hypothetical protein
MDRCRTGVFAGVAAGLGLAVTVASIAVAAQAQSGPAVPRQSVYGKLKSVDARQNNVVMASDAGESLGFRFEPAVIAEIAKFKPGDPMIVIYRPVSSSEKRATAIAFPGSSATPIYVNLTGDRVTLRSAAAVNGTCGPTGDSTVQESVIPAGGMAEASEACWCCAAAGQTCTPGNRTGLGRALLVRCFE